MKLEAGEAVKASQPHLIKRPRLTNLLDAASARIILLVAPAGYGKTTLAREWLSGRRHAWYRGTSASADVAALALGIARAAAVVVPGVDERLKARLRMSSAPSDEAEVLAEILAEDLLAEWPTETWLALDDYHFACDSAPAERFVEHLLSSATLHCLIASRSRPRWASARRVLYGEVYEVGRNILAMNQEEAHAILLGRNVTGERKLTSLADGWPALVGLVALTDEHALPGESMPDELYGYFAEELYQALAAHAQQTLRRLSLAPVITPDILDALFGNEVNDVVQDAARVGFFLSQGRDRLDLHPLLRSFLTSKFNKQRDDPDGEYICGLVRTLLERQDWDEAFEVIERFFDGDLLVELFEAALLKMIDEARLPTLQRWIRTAARYRFDSPIVDFAEAEVGLKQGDLRRAEAFAIQAARRMPSDHILMSKALWLAGMSAHLTSRDDAALGYFENAEQVATSEIDQRQALWGRFIAMNKLDAVSNAALLLDEFERGSDTSADELLRAATGRLMLASLTGTVLETLDSVDLLAPLSSKGRDPWVLSSFLNVHAALLTLGGRYTDACAAAARELEVALAYGLAFVVRNARFHSAGGLWGLRDFRGCTTALRASEKACLSADDDFLRMNIGILYARIHLATDSLTEALDVFERYQHPPSTEPMQAEYLAWWSLTHALSRNSRDALTLAHRAEAMSPRIEVTALVPWTRAILAMHQGRTSRRAVTRAYTVALQSGNIDAFITAYRAYPELLQVLSSDADKHVHLKTFLERARDHKLAQAAGLRLPPLPSAGSTVLSKREHEVLDLVCQGLTNKQIGRTLYITEATVKVHVRKICQKLGVRSRTEAAMRASELSG